MSTTAIVKKRAGIRRSLRTVVQLGDRLFPQSPTLAHIRRRGIHYLCWLNEYGGRRLFLGLYERPDRAAMGRLVRPGDICLDVGANIGIYTMQLARDCGSSGRVVAFEPVEQNRLMIRLSATINGFANVIARPEVVSSRSGSGAKSVRPEGGPSSLTYFLKEEAVSEGAGDGFTTITLDQVIEELALPRVDVMKIDVEGAEMDVLNGATALLGSERRPRFLMVEVADEYLRRFGSSAAEVFGFLNERGYEPHVARPDGSLAPAELKDVERHGNFFFVDGSRSAS